ncbi:methyl-accepting chemotaxis protein [Microbulbifer thermotolerans]|uniref:Chemotaxis protein n=3 Tax=Microbulbifer thermotolerans TaxID=252514 RepID=A0A143HIN1_MICTH|nr:methyl-accepting chemotaxis protein [Microbulbifer thermotolerans]AMX01351.1 chemotaxis protein [Microbulbifer thermotolerans]MCX2780292.1 methyl-accepting chemotaxis protein [Microbulbifer thermotolerans]MCX2782755.1 methyl-accepting chemotaxis protein [Microbulbifer thermotolerans]MCX2795510.1 methyl-accepting chemotaxis protein [Microbulbifer thermotolerans]MCX2800223.1 methyl-accepting chemotaxis protein [Microbulbifer thermotolerans]
MKTGSQSSFSALRSNPAALFMGLLVLAALAGLIVSIYLVQTQGDRDKQYLQQVAELRALSYQVVSHAPAATAGDEEAFAELEKVIGQMASTWNQLQGADPGTRRALESELTEFGLVWRQVREQADTIIGNKDSIIFLNDVASTLNDSLPELQAEHNNIVEILLANNAPANQVEQAQLQVWRAERIGRNIDKMLQGGDDAEAAADQFNTDASLFGKVVEGMKNGDVVMGISRVTDEEARQSLEEITELFEFVSSSVREIFEATPALFATRQAADGILASSPELLESLSKLNDRIVSLSGERQPNNQTIAIFAGIFVMLIFGMMIVAFSGTRRSLREESETNERNQQAIMQLLDELADLADGDLTTQATVTEAFTGAIADSINYTIDQLRVLVSRITTAAQEVSTLSQETQQTALHLAEASEHQAQEIAGASAAVNEMAVTIDQVSANAAESAQVAERSVQIASNGAKVVQNTIKGMDNIREQIQDTSKRIKRLGESSQEIGDIVSLINDIADQTNILALNAAIQASMAGEAGRGFAVVADEVQRLAERSAAATKQIEGLVKAIQSDTNEAVISMEQTTTEVVRGARLAQDAGVALEEIESVSTNLATLIQNISNAARQQASSAGHISNTMNVIQEITSQTSAGTQATAQSIGNLAKTAQTLRESVAGFKLPSEESAEESGDLYDVELPEVGNEDFPLLDTEDSQAMEAREDRALA